MFQNPSSNTWHEFAKEANGIFKAGYSGQSDSATFHYKSWTITFDHYTLWSEKNAAILTRVIAPVNLVDHFSFEIHKEGIIQKIAKLFGAQDIEIDYPEFDKAFTIKSNNEFKIKTLLRNKEIRNRIFSQKEVNIQISDQKGIWEGKLPKNEFELSYFMYDTIHDIEILKSLFDFFKLLLDELHEINIITPNDNPTNN